VGIDGWLIIGSIAIAVVFAFGEDPRHPVKVRIRRHDDDR